jgi:signal transduction histidine kinase
MNLHVRPSVAEWFATLSLSARLSFFVALIVFAVATSVAYLEVRSYEGHIERDLADAGRLAARSAASVLALQTAPYDPLDIRDSLHDLVAADPVIDAISVIERDQAGQLRVFTSTSTEEREELLSLAGRAMTTHSDASDRSSTLMLFALPVPGRDNYAVAVTVGLESLLQARSHELRVAFGFAIPTIVLVTLLVHLMVRQLVDRIDQATRDLSLRNTQLAASQNAMLALRESLSHTERVAALGQVAANVAHQAGTPLNLVSGYVQMIRDDPRTDERTRARLVTVDAQIQQVTRVLRTMLDRARQPSGLAIVALAHVIERVRELAQPRLSRANIQLELSVDSDLPLVKADAAQLEMALLNLVTNALDAMPDGGTLSIAARACPDGARLEIADTGGGIAAPIVDRLFEPWVTTKPAGQGSGLGLAIVRDVVRGHGGSIAVSNQPAGAVFVITLPAATSGRAAS